MGVVVRPNDRLCTYVFVIIRKEKGPPGITGRPFFECAL